MYSFELVTAQRCLSECIFSEGCVRVWVYLYLRVCTISSLMRSFRNACMCRRESRVRAYVYFILEPHHRARPLIRLCLAERDMHMRACLSARLRTCEFVQFAVPIFCNFAAKTFFLFQMSSIKHRGKALRCRGVPRHALIRRPLTDRCHR